MKTILTAAMLTIILMSGSIAVTARAQDQSGQKMQPENKMADTMMKQDGNMMKAHKKPKHKSGKRKSTSKPKMNSNSM
jgi:hypothetical protein